MIANAPGPNPHKVASEYQKYALDIVKDNKIELVVLSSRSLIYVLLEPGDHLVEYVFRIDNLTLYRYVFIFLNIFIVMLSYKHIIQSTFHNKKVDTLVLFYLFLLTPLLLLSTPHARFGSILIFFHLLFFSKEISKKPYFRKIDKHLFTNFVWYKNKIFSVSRLVLNKRLILWKNLKASLKQ